ncbi:MAG: histidinol-phosphatase [Clostridiales bacterium]|nr:histidinol-phosphatase [Clostridiales bacterium]
MPFLYDTHVHTCQGSKCGTSTGAEHARFYKEIGFQGIIITDHFFNGNTAVPRDLPWKERVELFCSGYEDALSEGQKIGLDVFFGWEQNFNHDEYLIYGLDKNWLLNHPEVESWTRAEQLQVVSKHGGCVVQAHPFRNRAYISQIILGPQFCHGVEVINMGNFAYNDAAAYRFAQEYGLTMTAGSDNHFSCADNWKDTIGGIVLDKPLASVMEYARIIREHLPLRFSVDESRFALQPDAPSLETFWLDENEQPSPTGRNWLHP